MTVKFFLRFKNTAFLLHYPYMSSQDDAKTIKKIAQKIQRARIKKGLTHAEVAHSAGLDTNAYAKLERGTTKPFGFTLIKICKAFGIKSSDIFLV